MVTKIPDLLSILKTYYIILYKYGPYNVVWFLLLLVIQALIETLSILSIYPFLYAVLNFGDGEGPDTSFRQYWVQIENIFENEYALLVATGLFCLFFIIVTNIYKFLAGYLVNKYCEDLRKNISSGVFHNFLDFDLNEFERECGEGFVHRAIVQPDLLVDQVFRPISFALGASFSVILVSASLLAIDPTVIISLIIPIVFYYFIIFTISKASSQNYGKIIEEVGAHRIDFVSESEKGIKGLMLDHRVGFIKNNFKDALTQFSDAKARYQTILLVPAFGLETLLFMIAIIGTLFFAQAFSNNPDEIRSYGSAFGLAVVALYKLKPNVHIVYQAILALKFGKNAFNKLYSLLIKFDKHSALKTGKADTLPISIIGEGSFSYQDITLLENVYLEIKAGQSVAITGSSGVGKSTLVDLLLGIRKSPDWKVKWRVQDTTELLDGSLRGRSAYVPQEPMLFNGTILTNIALADKINLSVRDISRLRDCLQISGLTSWVESLDQSIYSLLGRGGIQPSGGQRKRLALAKALYAKPNLLVLDEFTSGLDRQTAETVLTDVLAYARDKFTLICITHNLEEVVDFEMVLEIKSRNILIK